MTQYSLRGPHPTRSPSNKPSHLQLAPQQTDKPRGELPLVPTGRPKSQMGPAPTYLPTSPQPPCLKETAPRVLQGTSWWRGKCDSDLVMMSWGWWDPAFLTPAYQSTSARASLSFYCTGVWGFSFLLRHGSILPFHVKVNVTSLSFTAWLPPTPMWSLAPRHLTGKYPVFPSYLIVFLTAMILTRFLLLQLSHHPFQ